MDMKYKIIKKKNYFFLSQSFLLGWILNVDIFFSINICEKFTKNSIKIYMHHDISTAPLVEIDKEKDLSLRLSNYDHIFISDKKSLLMFQNLFLKSKDKLKKNMPKIFCVGYVKLDYLLKKISNHKNLEKNIVIAPSDYRHIDKLSIFHDLDNIIQNLLDETNFQIVFRPYPGIKNSKKVLQIKNKFSQNKSFILDLSDDYFDIYANSYCLITDISGTAFTFAYMTRRPVVFFSKFENSLNEMGYLKLDYFSDRKKIGIIAKSPKEIIECINNLKDVENKIKVTNKKLLEELQYLGNSKERVKTLIDEILTENYKIKNEKNN